MIIRFTPEADAELTEARQWYSHQRKDLDLEFMSASTPRYRELLLILIPFLSFTKTCGELWSDDSHSLCSMKLHLTKFT